MWGAFDRLHHPFNGLFKLLLVTAQRRGEVAGMKWCEIDGDGWVIPGARAKSGVGHRVPLSSLALEILDGLPRMGEHVSSCRADKPPRDFSGPKARVASLTPSIAPWVLHDLRRTAETQMRSAGIDRLVVSKLLNHAEAGVTRVYDRYAADPEKIAAMERWANRLRGIIAGETDQKNGHLQRT
ncbi:MAG: site-specific integrase [Methyloceanibacter sp.]